MMAGGFTPEYLQEIGLREGSVLSPAQFILFINGLAETMRAMGLGLEESSIWLGLLLYADDIVVLADTSEELLYMLERIHLYCRKWRLTLNLTKCNVMVFGESPAARTQRQTDPSQCHWKMGEGYIDETDAYKYLGVIVSYDLSWSKHHSKVISSVWNRVNESRQLGVRRNAPPPIRGAARLDYLLCPKNAIRYSSVG